MNYHSSFIRRAMAPAAVITAGTMLLSNCAQTSDGRLAQAQGTGLGAIAGAGLGYLVGGSDGAWVGAALGGAGGFAYGSHIANKKAKYASTEQWLDACIADAEAKRKSAVAYNQKLDQRIAALQREIRAAKAANDKAKLSQLKRTIQSEKGEVTKQRDAYKKEAELQRGAIREAGSEAPSKVKLLQNSTSGIETQAAGINRRVDRYAALESQIDV